jgi:nitroreductase
MRDGPGISPGPRNAVRPDRDDRADRTRRALPEEASSGPRPWNEDAAVTRALHPLLATRWSPTAFDHAHVATAEDVEALLEAARWAPSAGNSQPWAFIVGRRGDDVHRRLVAHLARSSAAWAPDASILTANLAHRFVEGTDWDYSEFSLYDLGQAVAHMTVQALALGLAGRQFRAFDRAAVEEEFAVPDHWQVTTMSAFGLPHTSHPDRDGPCGSGPRTRRPSEQMVWAPTRA